MGGPGETHKLPLHVASYLAKQKVVADDLPDEVIKVLAGLTTVEVALIERVGSTLRDARVDKDIICKVH